MPKATETVGHKGHEDHNELTSCTYVVSGFSPTGTS